MDVGSCGSCEPASASVEPKDAPGVPSAPPAPAAASSGSTAGSCGDGSGSACIKTLHRPCATCRAAKVLCNRELPCSRCRRLKIGDTCAAPPDVQRGRPSHHARLLQLRHHQEKQQQEAEAAERRAMQAMEAKDSNEATEAKEAGETRHPPTPTPIIQPSAPPQTSDAIDASVMEIATQAYLAVAPPAAPVAAPVASTSVPASTPGTMAGDAIYPSAPSCSSIPMLHPSPASGVVPMHAAAAAPTPDVAAPLLGWAGASSATLSSASMMLVPTSASAQHSFAGPLAGSLVGSPAMPSCAGPLSRALSSPPSDMSEGGSANASASASVHGDSAVSVDELNRIAQQAVAAQKYAQRNVDALRAQLLRMGVQPCV